MRVVTRVALVVVLLVAAAGLCLHYGVTYDENWPHPTGDQLEGDVDDFAGDRVLLVGEVQAVDETRDELTVAVTDSADDVVLELEVHDVDEAVEPGGVVQVYGVLGADRTMTPTETVVVDESPTATLYKYAVSVVGVVLAGGYFLAHWRIVPRRLGFEPRGEPGDRRNEVDRRG